MSHWIHIKIHQDTCILDSSSLYTSFYIHAISFGAISGYTEIQNHLDCTCILDASWRHFKIQSGYMQDTCKIHAKYMRNTCGIHVHAHIGYMRQCGIRILKYIKYIPLSGMYPDTRREISTYLRCKDTSEMHAEYMRDTSICRDELDTCGIHSRYIEDTYLIVTCHLIKCIQRRY